MDPTKCTFIADASGRANAFNPEDIMARRLNHWKGWHCAAGVENIFINADGDVFAGACQVGGKLGNVYQAGNQIRDRYMVCTREFCHCGSDMRLRKGRTAEDARAIQNLDPAKLNYTAEKIAAPTMVGRIWEQDIPLNLNWDIGRRCNYSCSYCNPYVSNNYEAHRNPEQLAFAADEIERFFSRGRRTKMVFTGGEPTLNPYFLTLVQLLHGRGHHIHTQSNGSRHAEYYAELLRHSLIGFSVHLEFFHRERFLKMMQHLLTLKSTREEYRWQWLGVRIMAGPSRVREALDLHRSIGSLAGAREHLNQLALAPLYDRARAEHLMDYPSGELDLIAAHT